MIHLAKAALFSQGSRVDLARVGALGDPVVSKMLRRQVTRRGMAGTYAFVNVYRVCDSVRGAVAVSATSMCVSTGEEGGSCLVASPSISAAGCKLSRVDHTKNPSTHLLPLPLSAKRPTTHHPPPTMPRSPDRYPRYPARRYTPDRSYDRRDSRDEYRRSRDDDRRPAPPGGSSYRGRGYSPSRGRDRSWERERDRERERDYPRDRDRYDDRERKRTRSPSPIRRRYSPPPPGDRFRPRYTSYDRAPSPRGAGLVYPPAETPLRDVAPEKREEADESEEEGMVTPPQAKRKPEVKRTSRARRWGWRC